MYFHVGLGSVARIRGRSVLIHPWEGLSLQKKFCPPVTLRPCMGRTQRPAWSTSYTPPWLYIEISTNPRRSSNWWTRRGAPPISFGGCRTAGPWWVYSCLSRISGSPGSSDGSVGRIFRVKQRDVVHTTLVDVVRSAKGDGKSGFGHVRTLSRPRGLGVTQEGWGEVCEGEGGGRWGGDGGRWEEAVGGGRGAWGEVGGRRGRESVV